MNVYTKTVCLLGSSLLALTVGVTTAHAGQLDGAQYLKNAKVKLVDARAIALKTCDGKIIAQELEKERGGSGLRYSFDIRKGEVVHEVGVDAKTGKVLENSIDKDSDEGDAD